MHPTRSWPCGSTLPSRRKFTAQLPRRWSASAQSTCWSTTRLQRRWRAGGNERSRASRCLRTHVLRRCRHDSSATPANARASLGHNRADHERRRPDHGARLWAILCGKTRTRGRLEALAAEVAPFGMRVLIVEPGAFRTRLFGSAFRAMPTLPVYAETVGATRAYVEKEAGTRSRRSRESCARNHRRGRCRSAKPSLAARCGRGERDTSQARAGGARRGALNEWRSPLRFD